MHMYPDAWMDPTKISLKGWIHKQTQLFFCPRIGSTIGGTLSEISRNSTGQQKLTTSLGERTKQVSRSVPNPHLD